MTRLLGFCCLLMLVAILVAGLWPFHVPANRVAWLPGRSGLQVGPDGLLATSRKFTPPLPEGPSTLELLLQPATALGEGTILAFDDFPNPRYSFAIRQLAGAVVVQRPAWNAEGTLVRGWWQTARVFQEKQPVLLTVTSDAQHALLYVNGVRAASSTEFRMVGRDLTGRLVLGSSTLRDDWQGEIDGLAVYGTALSPSQVEQNAQHWSANQAPTAGSAALEALYRFQEGSGHRVADLSGHGRDLFIPARYFVLRREYLTPFWVPLRSRWDGWVTASYWSDVAVNVLGFIPFGFFYAGWFSRRWHLARPRLAAFLLGMALSFFIESVQYFLPTRDSSMTDLLTNSLGSAVGAAAWARVPLPAWIPRFKEPHPVL